MKKLVVSILAGVIIAAGAFVVFASPFGVGGHDVGETKLEAELEAPVVEGAGDEEDLASGKMKWGERFFDDLTLERRRMSTELEDLATIGDHVVNVTRADGLGGFTTVATMILGVDALGNEVDSDLDSRDGDTVPILAAGDLVEVLDPGGVVILTGTLEPKS